MKTLVAGSKQNNPPIFDIDEIPEKRMHSKLMHELHP